MLPALLGPLLEAMTTMRPVYLSHPYKQFSGSRQPLSALVMDAAWAALSAGARPDLVLLVSAHPLESADIDGERLAEGTASELRRRRHRPLRVEYFANPGIHHPSAHLAASSAGAAVFHEAARRVAAGEEGSILVVAAEQMRLKGRDRTTQILRSLIHEDERRYGVTMPALGALLESNLEQEFPHLREALDELMFANRARATLNPRAHIRKEFRREDAHGPKNPVVSTPLRLWDVAPTSSGAAALLLSSRKPHAAADAPAVCVQVAGLGQGHDHVAISRRSQLHRSTATCEARGMLLADLGWTAAELRRRVRRAEIHDAFPVIEFLGLLDTGLAEPAEIVGAILRGDYSERGRLPINFSGGVMGGHPVGATGLGQLVELYLQAIGAATAEPSPPQLGYSLAFNVGGPLTYNFLTLLKTQDASGIEEIFWLPRRPPFSASDFDLEAPAPLTGPMPGRLLARTSLHIPPPGFEAPLGLALVEVAGQPRLAACPGNHRVGTRVWVGESGGRLVVRSGPGIDGSIAGPGLAHPPVRPRAS